MFDRVRGLGVAVVSETVVSRGWRGGGRRRACDEQMDRQTENAAEVIQSVDSP